MPKACLKVRILKWLIILCAMDFNSLVMSVRVASNLINHENTRYDNRK